MKGKKVEKYWYILIFNDIHLSGIANSTTWVRFTYIYRDSKIKQVWQCSKFIRYRWRRWMNELNIHKNSCAKFCYNALLTNLSNVCKYLELTKPRNIEEIGAFKYSLIKRIKINLVLRTSRKLQTVHLLQPLNITVLNLIIWKFSFCGH